MTFSGWQKSRPISNLGTDKEVQSNDMGNFSGEAYQKWYDDMLDKHDTEGIAKYFDFIMGVDVTDYPKQIKVPTLVVSPKNSMASPLSLNKEVASQIPDSRLAVIDSVGHMVYIDQPDATCKAILTWVEDLKARKK